VVGALLIALLRRHALSALVPYTTLFRSTAIAPGHGLLASSGAHHGAGWNKPWFKTFTLACSRTIRVHSFGPVKALALRPLPAVASMLPGLASSMAFMALWCGRGACRKPLATHLFCSSHAVRNLPT